MRLSQKMRLAELRQKERMQAMLVQSRQLDGEGRLLAPRKFFSRVQTLQTQLKRPGTRNDRVLERLVLQELHKLEQLRPLVS